MTKPKTNALVALVLNTHKVNVSCYFFAKNQLYNIKIVKLEIFEKTQHFSVYSNFFRY